MSRVILFTYLTSFLITFQACTPKEKSSDTSADLKTAYRDAFRIGSAMNHDMVIGNDSLATEILLAQCNAVTAENVMKAALIQPKEGQFVWDAADAFVNFGGENGMFVIGHTLAWHNQTPDWFFYDETGVPLESELVKEHLLDHIEAVASRYAKNVNAWDVVNEVIDNDGSYRPTKWVKGFGDGDDFVKTAFSQTARFAPDAELYYNDFNAWRPAKRDGIMRMVRMLQAEGIKIDGIGIQGHWGLNFPKNEYIEAAIDSFASLGVKVMITELDIDVLPLTKEGQIIGQTMSDPQFQLEEFKTFFDPFQNGLPADVEKAQADRYHELFHIFYQKKDKIDRVTFWGIADDMSWKNGYPIPDRTNYPLVWDRNRQAKASLGAILEVVSEENQ